MDKGKRDGESRRSGSAKGAVPKEGVDVVVSMGSYEERFVLGLEEMLVRWSPRSAIFMQLEEWREWTDDQLDLARAIAESRSAESETHVLSYNDRVGTWRKLGSVLTRQRFEGKAVCVDISTMPREIIWLVFFLLSEAGAKLYYEYHSPGEYADWLSRDPGQPRFPFKLSGVARLGRPTILLVASGFDTSRTTQLVRTYHPERVIVAFQEQGPYQREEGQPEAHRSAIREFIGGVGIAIDSVGIDAFGRGHGVDEMTRAIKPYIESANIIMASTGPKLTAVALYQIWTKFPDTALSYAPAKEFNREYSSGLGESVWGTLFAADVAGEATKSGASKAVEGKRGKR